MVSAAPLQLNEKKKKAVLGINRLISSECPPLRVGASRWFVSFVAALTEHPSRNQEEWLHIDVQVGNAELVLVIDISSIFLLMDSYAPQKEKFDFSLPVQPWVALACLEAALQNTLEELEHHLDAKILLSLTNQADVERHSWQNIFLQARVQHESNGQSFMVVFKCDEHSLTSLLRQYPRKAVITQPAMINTLAQVSIVCHLSLCWIRIKQGRFLRVQPGDTFALMISSLQDGAIPVRGTIGGIVFLAGRLYPKKLVIDMIQNNDDSARDDGLSFDDDDFESEWEEFEDDEEEQPAPASAPKRPAYNPSATEGSQQRQSSPAAAQTARGAREYSAPSSQFRADEDLLDDVALKIDLRISQLNIPIGNLKSFAPGMTIELEQNLPATVDFVANEKVIAQGELVDIEGTLGVVVTHIGRKEG